MGSTKNTRARIANGQSVKAADAIRLLDSVCTDQRTGKGSHRVYFIGTDRLVLSKPKGDQLMRYQLRQIDEWLTRHGK